MLFFRSADQPPASELCRRGAKLIYSGKTAGEHSTCQRNIEQSLIDRALDGKIVVDLKGGDLSFLGGEDDQLGTSRCANDHRSFVYQVPKK